MSPVVRLQYGCNHTIQIPGKAKWLHLVQIVEWISFDNSVFILVADADGDIIRCRWAEYSHGECSGVCKALPGATLSGVCID